MDLVDLRNAVLSISVLKAITSKLVKTTKKNSYL